MKILHSELQEVCGGIESFLMNISNEMDTNAIQFEYLMRGTNEQIVGSVKGVVHRVPDNRIKYIFFIIAFLKNNKFDIIHLHKNSAADMLLPILIRVFSRGSYVIVHSHNSQPSASSGILKILHRLNRGMLCSMADASLACSDVAAKWMFGKKGCANRVKYIKNGIQIEKYVFNREIRKRIRAQYKICDVAFLIGNVGRLSKQKNQIFLIPILAEVIKRGYSVKLIICGEGEEKQAIMEEAERLQVLDDVILPGACSNIHEMLQAMDVFVMPSLYEGLTIAAIEAQCAGLPCVFSDTMSGETILSHHCHVLSLRDGAEKWSDAICNSFDVVRADMTDVIRSSGYDNKETAQTLTNFYNEVYEAGRADLPKATFFGVGFAVLATFLARGVGFIRELFVANVFGTSAFGDSFIVAFSIPDILADGFSYAIAQLYIPTYFKIKGEKNSVEEESKFNTGTLFFTLLIGFFFVIAVECFPEIFTKLFASGFSEDTLQITVKMLRVMILSVPLICVAALFKAYGQIIKKFGLFVALGIIIN
ncbi:MAG: glycosyltransferase, partial [Roseburia sp.]|nr:glycosyltransferase [Roseburia sp.]